MASLFFDEASEHFFVRFRYGGRSFKRSLGTSKERLAQAQASRIEETLILLKNGRLSTPPNADPVAFILSDGRRNSFESPKLPTLVEVTTAFKAARIPGHKEATTVSTENTHIRHLLRIMKGKTFAHTIGQTALQSYVATRLGEVVGAKRPISAETVRKEIATFRVIWNWAVKEGMLEGQAAVVGLVYPKRDEKPPFMPIEQIEHIIERDRPCAADERRLWECLYLRGQEVLEALKHLEIHSVESYLHPMTLLIAHTGIRRSEAIRSLRDDFDFRHGTLLVREKKRSRTRAITFRRVELTGEAQVILTNWLKTNIHGPTLLLVPTMIAVLHHLDHRSKSIRAPLTMTSRRHSKAANGKTSAASTFFVTRLRQTSPQRASTSGSSTNGWDIRPKRCAADIGIYFRRPRRLPLLSFFQKPRYGSTEPDTQALLLSISRCVEQLPSCFGASLSTRDWVIEWHNGECRSKLGQHISVIPTSSAFNV